jgi:hypothetical protein
MGSGCCRSIIKAEKIMAIPVRLLMLQHGCLATIRHSANHPLSVIRLPFGSARNPPLTGAQDWRIIEPDRPARTTRRKTETFAAPSSHLLRSRQPDRRDPRIGEAVRGPRFGAPGCSTHPPIEVNQVAMICWQG